MKKILKVVSGFAAVVAAACLLTGSAQARTFVSVNVGGYGYAPYCAPACSAPVYAAPVCAAPVYAAPCYPVEYCYRAPVVYRPVYGCYAPRFFRFCGFWR